MSDARASLSQGGLTQSKEVTTFGKISLLKIWIEQKKMKLKYRERIYFGEDQSLPRTTLSVESTLPRNQGFLDNHMSQENH